MSVITSGEFWTAIGAIGTIAALFHAIRSYNKDVKIGQQQRTVEAYLPIREKYYELTEKLKTLGDKDREMLLKEYLSEMEILSAGVNSGAYSLDYINRVSGGKLVRQYENITKEFIKRRRTNKKQHNIDPEDIYCEYETMMKALFKLRGEEWKNGNTDLR